LFDVALDTPLKNLFQPQQNTQKPELMSGSYNGVIDFFNLHYNTKFSYSLLFYMGPHPV